MDSLKITPNRKHRAFSDNINAYLLYIKSSIKATENEAFFLPFSVKIMKKEDFFILTPFLLPEFLKTLISALPAQTSEPTNEPPTVQASPPPAPAETPAPEEKENRFLRLMERHEKAVKKIERGNKKP